MKVFVIIYLVGASLAYVATMVWFFSGWRQMMKEEEEYPEGAGAGIVAACTLFIIALLMALLWPFEPILLLALFVYDRIREKYPELCGMDEEEGERDTEADSGEGGRDHICQ